jgi:hypothetical protein
MMSCLEACRECMHMCGLRSQLEKELKELEGQMAALGQEGEQVG